MATILSSTYVASGSRLAAGAATWCGVHCALTPFLAGAAPALALSEGVERVLWAGTVLLGAVILVMGPARRNAAPVLTFARAGPCSGEPPSPVGSSHCPRR